VSDWQLDSLEDCLKLGSFSWCFL